MVEFQIVKREAIPSISTIDKEGEAHGIGEFRDFRWSDTLREFMPALSEFSLSFAQLAHGEVLQAHTHPIQSMMVIYSGAGEVFGDLCQPLVEGDVLVVPPGCSHGFVGGPQGMFAVTVQLGQGFYTDRQTPRIAFVDTEPSLKALLEYNEQRLTAFGEGAFFELLSDGTLDAPERRRVYGDLVASWLAGNETTMLSRRATSRQPVYVGQERPNLARCDERPTTSDAVVEAMTGWFDYQMFVLDDVEKASVVELVLKRSRAALLSRAAASLMQYQDVRSTLLDGMQSAHTTSSDVSMLRKESVRTYARLQRIVAEAWDMVDAIGERIAARTRTV